MPSLMKSSFLSLSWQGQLQDYVTVMDWSPNGEWLAIASGSGEVVLLNVLNKQIIAIEPSADESIGCLGFSYDGQFLAAGGQDGQVKVWRMPVDLTLTTLVKVLEHSRTWIEHLAWSPTQNELAFSVGRCVQVWDMDRGEMVVTLPFETSSVLDLAGQILDGVAQGFSTLVWNPKGNLLAAGGQQGEWLIWGKSGRGKGFSR